MTIYLPDNISNFRQAFNEICDRILSSEYDETFFKLMLDLIVILKKHSLTKGYFKNFKNEYSKWQQEYIAIASNVLEYNWKKLWQYHRHRYNHRKQLIRIKRIVAGPFAMEFSPLYPRAICTMGQFRHFSPFFRCIVEARFLFRASQSQINSWAFLGKQFRTTIDQISNHRKATIIKPKKNDWKKDKIYAIFTTIKRKNLILNDIQKYFKINAEPFTSLFSPQAKILEQKFGIPGCNNDEKRRNMLIRAETDSFYCLERFRFLEQCLNAPNCLQPVQYFAKLKKKIDPKIWMSAFERCEREALWYAKAAYLQRSTSNQHMDAFVSYDYAIRRRDFEKYLSALKNHVHTYLYQIDNQKQEPKDSPLMVLPGTQSANFVIDLAKKFWKTSPTAIYDEVYSDYLTKCPSSKLLSRPSWERIVRERKLDPRQSTQKKRRKGKKTLQN